MANGSVASVPGVMPREIVMAHAGRVDGILRLRGVPKPRRYDLVQEVFIRATEHWHQCATPDAPKPWIDEIARNVERENRRERLRAERWLDHEADPSRLPGPDIETERHRAARLDLVRQLLQQIEDEDWREVVTRRIEGQTNAEIAEALRRPKGTVAWWFQQGKRELLAALARHDERERDANRKLGVLPLFAVGPTCLFDGGLLDNIEAPQSLKDRLDTPPEHGGGGGGPAAPEMLRTASLSPLGPAAPLWWGGVLVTGACVVAVVELGIIIGLLLHPPHRSHAEPVELRAELVTATVTSNAPPSSGPPPSPLPSATPAPSSAPAPGTLVGVTMTADTGAAEHEILDPAERDLLAHHPRAALLAIAKHERLYPHGTLAAWREHLRSRALAKTSVVVVEGGGAR